MAVYLAFDVPQRIAGGGPGGGSGSSASGGAPAGAEPAGDAGVHRIDVVSGRATVRVNGKPLGDTPIDYVGRVGDTVSVELKQDGFEPMREDIQVTTTGTSTFNMRRAAREQP